MTLKPKEEWTPADHAYAALRAAIVDPGVRQAADENPELGEIVRKLSDQDLQVLSRVINEQSLSGHGQPFTLPD